MQKRSSRFRLGLGLSVVGALLAAGVVYVVLNNQKDSHANPPTPAGKIWKQIWGDEFNGGSLDGSKWNVENNSNFGKSGRIDNCYRTGNVQVSGGYLHLIAKREKVSCGGTNPDTGNSTYYFTSGMVHTRKYGGPMKFKFAQGYIEARIKAPKGNPYWPAFWLVGPEDGSAPAWPDYGEFDIVETYGGRPDLAFGTFHYKCSNGSCKTSDNFFNLKKGDANRSAAGLGTLLNTPAAFSSYSGGNTSFHTYGLNWEANRMTWYIDGRKVRFFDGSKVYRIEKNGAQTHESTPPAGSIAFSKVMSYPHSIILNLAFGGNGPSYSTFGYTGKEGSGSYNNGNLVASLSDAMQVDYVRVFQLANAPAPSPAPAPTPTPAPSPSPSPAPPVTPPTTDVGDDATSGETDSESANWDEAAIVEDTSGESVSVASDNTTVAGDAVIAPQLATDEATQEGVAAVEYYVNDTLKATISKSPFKFDTTALPDGTYNLTEKIRYKDGKVQARTAYIVVRNKKLAPLPKSTAKTSGSQTILWTTIGTIVVLALILAIIPRTRQAGLGMVRRLFHRGA